MNVLTAAVDTEPGGFTFTKPGEIVYLGLVCDRDRHGAADCGCSRAFAGVASTRSTTLAEVAESEVDRDELAATLAAASGWSILSARHWAADMLAIAARFPVGTRLRRYIDAVEPA